MPNAYLDRVHSVLHLPVVRISSAPNCRLLSTHTDIHVQPKGQLQHYVLRLQLISVRELDDHSTIYLSYHNSKQPRRNIDVNSKPGGSEEDNRAEDLEPSQGNDQLGRQPSSTMSVPIREPGICGAA